MAHKRHREAEGNPASVVIAAPTTTRAKLTRADGTTEEVVLAIPLGPPVTLRLPPPGQNCPICGLTRSFTNELILPTPRNDFKPPVKSYVLKQRPDCKTGVRLVDAQSLFDYIRQHPAYGPNLA